MVFSTLPYKSHIYNFFEEENKYSLSSIIPEIKKVATFSLIIYVIELDKLVVVSYDCKIK